MRWGNCPYSNMYLAHFLQLFPTYYWVCILMAIAYACEYCVLFITTTDYVCSASFVPMDVRTGLSLFLWRSFWASDSLFFHLAISVCLPFPPAGFGSTCGPWFELSPIRLSPCPATAVQGVPFKGHPPTATRGPEQSWCRHCWRRSCCFSRNCGPHSVH